MLRNDGRYEIFVIEFCPQGSKDWARISFDVAWVPPEIYAKKQKVWKKFSAVGKCWQETGVHGTYDVEDAISLYVMLKEHSKENYHFRVVKKTIWQDSEVLYAN